MNDTQDSLLLRTAITATALVLALGINAAAAYAMGHSGTPLGRSQHIVVADLGTLPTVTVRACRTDS